MFQFIRNVRRMLSGEDSGQNNPDFERLLEDSRAYLTTCQEDLNRRYGLTGRDRYEWNASDGELVFFDDDVPVVVAATQFAGSVSNTSDTWQWGWANSDFSASIYEKLDPVYDFGEAHNIPELVDPHWEASEADGWDMAAICIYMIEAEGVYRASYETGSAFFVITEIADHEK